MLIVVAHAVGITGKEGEVVGETYHSKRYPLARSVTGDGEISDINWAIGTTPPDILNGFACSVVDNSAWAINSKGVYLASDGYSFAEVYVATDVQTINNVAYYDENRCIVTVYQTSPSGNTNISLVNTDGNIQIIYNTSSAYPILADIVATEFFIVAPKAGVAQVVWADRGDLVFNSFAVGSEIKKIASFGMTTYGISIDGTKVYAWDGKGQNERVLRTFEDVVLNDIVAVAGKIYVVGVTVGWGCCYMYNGTDWVDHEPSGRENPFLCVEVSPANPLDVIVGCANGFYASSNGFTTEPQPLTVRSGTEPTNVQHIAVDVTGDFTVFFGVDGTGKGFNYRSGDISTTIVTDLLEHVYDGTVIGMSPIGYIVEKKIIDEYWTRRRMMLTPASTYEQRQTISEGNNGEIYIQDDEGRIGVSLDGGETFAVATSSPIGRTDRGGGFIGGLVGNTSIICLGAGELAKSQDDWETSTEWMPFNADQSVSCFSRDLSRKDMVYLAVSQRTAGTNVCKVYRLDVSSDWEVPTELLNVSLDGGRYFTYIASYNDRIVVAQSDGALRYSVDSGLTWSAENTTIMDTPATVEGIASLWIENTTDCIYISKHGGVFYNTFYGLDNGLDWIIEDVPVSSDQEVGAFIVTKERTFGALGNVGVGLYWRRYDN